MNYVIFNDPPENFSPTVEAAGCFCEFASKILFVKRSAKSLQGNTWTIPGGKLEKGEDSRTAVIRELYEEVGFDISYDLLLIGKLYVRLPHIDYIFYVFHKSFSTIPSVILNEEEHADVQWLTSTEAKQLPLIIAGREVIDYYEEFFKKQLFYNFSL